MPLADTLNRKPGDILKSDDWNIIIKEIDRLETAKINRDGADTLKGPLTIAESLKVNSNVTISGNLSVTNVLEIGTPPFAGNTGGNRDWMQKGIKINWDSDSLFIGLKNEGTNRKDAVIAWGDDPQDDLRFVNVLAGGEVQGKELMRIKPSGNVGIGTNNPIASLDIASASRTGTHPTAVKGLYITGDFNADNDGVEFRHSNGTQGIGFGFNTIYAAGSNPNQDLQLKPKGTGEVKVAGSLSVSGIVKAQALTLSQSGGQFSGMASFMSKNPEPPYINWYHSRSGADQDLKRYGYIQAGDDGIKEFRFVAENGANFKFSGGNLTVSGDLSVTGSVNFSLQTRQMLNLWSTNYGIGIQSSTQYFRSSANFAWYRGGSHNDAELNAGGGISLMTLDSNGNLSVSGIVKIGSLQLGGFNSEDKQEWPIVVWYRNTDQNWDEGLIKHSSDKGFFKKAGFGIHFHEKRQFGFWSTGWNPLFAVDGGTGNTYIKGNIGTRGHDPNGGGNYPSSWGGGVHTWDVIAEATVGYSNLQKWSSIKEKNNIRPLGKVLDKLDKLNPVFFDRMKQYRNGKANNLGFIAEEVREVFPEIIEEYNPDNPEFFAAAMQMDAIATLSIAGIQELSRKLKILKQGISVDRWGNVAIGQKKPLQDHKLYISGDLRIDCKTSAEASSGQAILPANPVGFMIINVGGKDYKIPYYDL
ncbi:tail fiber domain-containing protein [Microcystis aeruginosa]|uniref:Peptidase S74 domain-containing protein n=1 Tax=Microcystis aeruginosa 11-30S32 TaxID=2358142 RepID=A0A510PL17_MICAE|nr:tail fiber domain-containing protein [Microcystis aeruginosa]GCA94524.1 hypothetical protein MAE30S32_31760 [Microcystis aeruginosa 11-30S32]